MLGMLQGIFRRHPDLDLDTVRATLEYMRDDLGGVAGLERAAAALDVAIGEIAAVERSARVAEPPAEPVGAPSFRKLIDR